MKRSLEIHLWMAIDKSCIDYLLLMQSSLYHCSHSLLLHLKRLIKLLLSHLMAVTLKLLVQQ